MICTVIASYKKPSWFVPGSILSLLCSNAVNYVVIVSLGYQAGGYVSLEENHLYIFLM